MGKLINAIKVEGDDLQLLKDLMAIRTDADAFQAKLNEEFQQRAQEADAAFAERHKALWDQVYAKYGLDPDGNFSIDGAYIDTLGVGFIAETDQGCACGGDHDDDHPFAGLAKLLGGGRVKVVGIGAGDEEDAPQPERVLN